MANKKEGGKLDGHEVRGSVRNEKKENVYKLCG